MAKNLGDNGLPGIALSVSIFLVIVVVLLQSFTYFYVIFYLGYFIGLLALLLVCAPNLALLAHRTLH